MNSNTEPTRSHLLHLARRHNPYDDTEMRHRDAVVDWLSRSPGVNPFDRDVFVPGHATGSCFVVSTQKRAALIFHKNLKLWVQPGGHAEKGETDPLAVAAREATEELGVTVGEVELFDFDVHRIAARGEVPGHTHFDFRSLAVIEPVELEPATDAAEARWLTRSEISAIGVDIGVRRMADKAVERGLLIR